MSHWSQPEFMCSKSTIETLEQDKKSAQIQQWGYQNIINSCCSGVVIVSFGHFLTSSSNVSIVISQTCQMSVMIPDHPLYLSKSLMLQHCDKLLNQY